MTHNEIRYEFEKRINDAKAIIERTKNADALEVKTSMFYIDDAFEESETFDERGETSIVAYLAVYIKGRCTDDDPSYYLSILCDLKGSMVKAPGELEKEYKNFDEELSRFLRELSCADNAEAYIEAESERLEKEGEEEVKKLEASLKKLTRGIIIGCIVLGIFVLAVIIISLI